MNGHITASPPLALPTLDRLGAIVNDDVDASGIARTWFTLFAKKVEVHDIDGVLDLFLADALWRDLLVFTWDFRTFHGTQRIATFLHDRLSSAHARAFTLKREFLELQRSYPDIVWIQALFDFETDLGSASGVFRLVPVGGNGEWKAHCMFTNLEGLRGHPEKVGALRNAMPNHGLWESEREREVKFEDSDPTVVIVGAGQAGLGFAARLKALGISALVVERNERIGDNWRNRYDALCLHDQVWYDHLPYVPFPSMWPVYTPARKLADWFESYAQTLELNVWTASNVEHASQDSETGMWSISIRRKDGSHRILQSKYFVFTTGFGDGYKAIPSIPGMDEFKGTIMHSTKYKSAKDYEGKKVVVIGACTSGHDVAMDCYNQGIDVTMFQRSSTYVMSAKNGLDVILGALYAENAPPTEVADKISASFPHVLTEAGLGERKVAAIAKADREILEALEKSGFRLDTGIKGAGFLLSVWERAGGYYIDVGASQLIVDGKIKLKNDSQIERFTPTGILFDNGSTLDADVRIISTSVGDVRDAIRPVCGDELTDRVKRIWGLDEEREVCGCWRDIGVKNLFYGIGMRSSCTVHFT
ncbi:FAD/NAD(P)-binding domain-containing protein [Fistulina hepatica ATCC 64428]|uniref:FAD/NAD(P)-binding domain-containing protein n=1 Tax=Fistulina hepatica ATCC 64428 TaxID=1128425 RepID=A0A0D7ANA5_9AGAR|nr:FAD/NAD(P)-binding domain-containing protein [Fistulina hepatica ATCC 64428]